jgi:hypothetical protein
MAGADRMTIEEVVKDVMVREHGDVLRAAVEAVCAEPSAKPRTAPSAMAVPIRTCARLRTAAAAAATSVLLVLIGSSDLFAWLRHAEHLCHLGLLHSPSGLRDRRAASADGIARAVVARIEKVIKRRALQISASSFGVSALRPLRRRAIPGANEPRAIKACLAQCGAAEVRSSKVGPVEYRSSKVGLVEYRAAEVGGDESCSAQVGATKSRVAKVNPDQSKPAERGCPHLRPEE